MIFGSKPAATTPAKRRFMNTPSRTPLKQRKVGYDCTLLLCFLYLPSYSPIGINCITVALEQGKERGVMCDGVERFVIVLLYYCVCIATLLLSSELFYVTLNDA